MKSILRISLTAFLLVPLFSACTDHLSRPLSPQQQRLKSITESGIVNPMFSTTFEYDAQNRQTGYTFTSYYQTIQTTHATITYDAQGHYQRIDQETKTGTGASVSSQTTLFTYQPNGFGGSLVTASYYQGSTPGIQYIYQLDANNRLVRSDFVQTPGATPITYTYTYTGDNITQAVDVGQNRTITYTLDDKPNPFYGLIRASEPLEWGSRRFSRNNIIAEQINGGASGGANYGPQYNAQGLLSGINNYTLAYEPY